MLPGGRPNIAHCLFLRVFVAYEVLGGPCWGTSGGGGERGGGLLVADHTGTVSDVRMRLDQSK